MKKMISALMLAAALFITSCSAAGAPELLEFIKNMDENMDYGGVKVIIHSEKNEMNDTDTAWKRILSYDTNTNYGDAINSRIKDIEEGLGVDIVLETDEEGSSTMRLKLMAGTYMADLVNYTDFGGMQNFAAANLLYPITDFSDYIDLSETWKYGDANVLEGGMINSVPYSVQPILWPDWQATGISSIIYNLDIMKENAITDPHEFWENQNWTWENFEETYLKGVTLSKEGTWVFSASEKLYFYGLAYSNDVQYVSAGPDGNYIVNARPQELFEVLQVGAQWYSDYRDKMELFSAFWDHEAFDEGNAFMTISSATLAGTHEDISCGLMPFPSGPSNTYGTWAQAFDRIQGFGIPRSSFNPDVAAHVLSELFEPFDDYIGPIEDYYREMIFMTDLDAEIYMELISDARYDYTFDGGSDLMRAVNNNFSGAMVSGKSPGEALDLYSNAVLAIVEEHALPNYDYMYKNYYSELEE